METYIKPLLYQNISTSMRDECDDIFKQYARREVTSEYTIAYMNALANLATRFQLSTDTFDYITSWANMVTRSEKNRRIQIDK